MNSWLDSIFGNLDNKNGGWSCTCSSCQVARVVLWILLLAAVLIGFIGRGESF